MDLYRPYDQSIVFGADQDDGTPIPCKEIPTKGLSCLGDLADDFVFFTWSVVFDCGALEVQHLRDFRHDHGEHVRFVFLNFEQPIYRYPRGLAYKTLWGIARDDWEPLWQFLVSIAIMDHSTREVKRIGLQEVLILDPVYNDLRKGKVLHITPETPGLYIGAFGLNSNKRRIAFDPQRSSILERPRLREYSPAEEEIVFARALFAGDNPINARGDLLAAKEEKERDQIDRQDSG